MHFGLPHHKFWVGYGQLDLPRCASVPSGITGERCMGVGDGHLENKIVICLITLRCKVNNFTGEDRGVDGNRGLIVGCGRVKWSRARDCFNPFLPKALFWISDFCIELLLPNISRTTTYFDIVSGWTVACRAAYSMIICPPRLQLRGHQRFFSLSTICSVTGNQSQLCPEQ